MNVTRAGRLQSITMQNSLMATELIQEFEWQAKNLVQMGFLRVAGETPDEFRRQIEPLRDRVRHLAPLPWGDNNARIPFVIVPRNNWVDPTRALPLTALKGKAGFTNMDAEEFSRFTPIAGIQLPVERAYLALDIDTGKGSQNVTPDEALKTIREARRSPLTIDEGVAVVVHYPDMLRKNNGFSMLGSRCGDRRVTALWVSAGRPRLGWCWAGNPHTWLGSASCAGRVAA
jgi:uncharacterized protein DUF5701